jgi:serine protease Do
MRHRGMVNYAEHRYVAFAGLIVALFMTGAAWGGVTPELQGVIRNATFEVVSKKPTPDPVTYEKPLPLDLLPFIERTDLYRSIGTAFAIGKNTYVTAAHVLAATIDSQFGPPMLRGSDGNVHAIASILKFSHHEDFVVFSLADDAGSIGLPTATMRHLDEPVLAVGDALGDGIVIRDGLLTSETPEEQDGRWKWLRFSAAASPGNSGGPLLDSEGRVIGVVIAKSPNENLNYALPITNVLDAPNGKARFDLRFVDGLAFIQGSTTYSLKDEFSLPLPWQQFSQAYQAVMERHTDRARDQLLSAYADSMFPKGTGTESILYSIAASTREMGVVIQQPSNNWTIERPRFAEVDLPGDVTVASTQVVQMTIVRLRRAQTVPDKAFYGDSKGFMDVALKSLNLRRQVGTDAVRVTSLGAAKSDATISDRYARIWQQRVWPVPYLDLYVTGLLLPTPDGYVAALALVPSANLRDFQKRLALFANQITLDYSGTLAQWQGFLAQPALLPQALKRITLSSANGWKLHVGRFEMTVPPALLGLDQHSKLMLDMGFISEGAAVSWDVGGAWWYRNTEEKSYFGLWRQPRPPATATVELRNTFDDVRARHPPYDGEPVPRPDGVFSVADLIEVPGTKSGTVAADLAYVMDLGLEGRLTRAQIREQQQTGLKSIYILEKSGGAETVATPNPGAINDRTAFLRNAQDAAKQLSDAIGPDVRGRTFNQDFDDYITAPIYKVLGMPVAAPTMLLKASAANELTPENIESHGMQRLSDLKAYWLVAAPAVHNRDVWPAFLANNHMPSETAHTAAVQAAEASMYAAYRDLPPGPEWARRSEALNAAYIQERRSMPLNALPDTSLVYHSRTSACPTAIAHTSGAPRAKLPGVIPDLSDFYPPKLQRLAQEGSVILSIRVSAAGCVTAVAIRRSSGMDEMDVAAREWIETASFMPGELDGVAVESTVPLAVNFQLKN